MFFWVIFGNVFTQWTENSFFPPVVGCYMAHFEFKTNLRLGVSDRQGNYAFVQESSYIQGILSYINEKDTSFLDYKHKHMLENGAPPDKFGVLYRLLDTELCYILGLTHSF